MPNVTTGYGRFCDSIAFFGNIHILLHFWNVITQTIENIYIYFLVCGYNFIKLLQIVFSSRRVEMKSKPM